jgi:hypothetical protein
LLHEIAAQCILQPSFLPCTRNEYPDACYEDACNLNDDSNVLKRSGKVTSVMLFKFSNDAEIQSGDYLLAASAANSIPKMYKQYYTSLGCGT